MSFDNELGTLLGNNDDGLNQAEAEVLKSLLDEKNPLFKSEISRQEMPKFIACWSFSNSLGLQMYLTFLQIFLKSKVPRDRSRVREIIDVMRRGNNENKGNSIWERLKEKKI